MATGFREGGAKMMAGMGKLFGAGKDKDKEREKDRGGR